MRSELPKVLHRIGGKPMLQHLLETTRILKPHRTHVVVGYGADRVIDVIESQFPGENQNPHIEAGCEIDCGINWVEQTEQCGTGHAVMQVLPHIAADATVLILNGDMPLISRRTLQLVSRCRNNLILLTSNLPNPTGLGRIIRNSDNEIIGIVEEKDASAAQQGITEVNTNCMSLKAEHLGAWLPSLQCANAQKEYYLTDVIACAVKNNVRVVDISAPDPVETMGVNSRSDLGRLERCYQARLADQIMANGVTLLDSTRFDLRGTCEFGIDCILDINVILEGRVKFGNRVSVGPNTLIRNACIGDDSVIEANSVIDHATIGKNCTIGPFARIRPETVLQDRVRIGNFVEIKKSHIKHNSKANHLSYVGDSQVGENVNIGAGVITCNYDGANKHQTIIGDDVFVGSNSQLVAPVQIGDGATVGAGSTITDNIEPDCLAMGRARQTTINGWTRPPKRAPRCKPD